MKLNPQRLDHRNDRLLLIFARNPEPGKCKTRLAEDIGDEAALEIYRFLLRHTASMTSELPVDKRVCYADAIWENDIWDPRIYQKRLQRGNDLGQRMHLSFQEGFADGYRKVIIIGTDLYDLDQADLEQAFKALDNADYVLGPARDGGYYLLGMKRPDELIFRNKSWGSDRVLSQTLEDLRDEKVVLLPEKNDIDVLDDIRDNPVFDQFLKHL